MRDYIDSQVTPAKRPVPSPTWGPSPSCKQAIRCRPYSTNEIMRCIFHSTTLYVRSQQLVRVVKLSSCEKYFSTRIMSTVLDMTVQNHTQFQTKMGKVHTRFQTIMVQKPYHLGWHTATGLDQMCYKILKLAVPVFTDN